jgi:hypothetical protein
MPVVERVRRYIVDDLMVLSPCIGACFSASRSSGGRSPSGAIRRRPEWYRPVEPPNFEKPVQSIESDLISASRAATVSQTAPD